MKIPVSFRDVSFVPRVRIPSAAHKLWFWLTNDTRCFRCGTVTHRAWIDVGPYPGLSGRRETSGVCKRCEAGFLAEINQLKGAK